eukprot:15476437-Alexandrium_andersonii.AAC.1
MNIPTDISICRCVDVSIYLSTGRSTYRSADVSNCRTIDRSIDLPVGLSIGTAAEQPRANPGQPIRL